MDEIKLSDAMFEKVNILKDFNYKHIYKNSKLSKYSEMGENILEELFDYLLQIHSDTGNNYEEYKRSDMELNRHFGSYLGRYKSVYEDEGFIPKRIVCDYIAGMTDGYAINAYKQIKIPEAIKFK